MLFYNIFYSHIPPNFLNGNFYIYGGHLVKANGIIRVLKYILQNTLFHIYKYVKYVEIYTKFKLHVSNINGIGYDWIVR
jgi:hypothetical protein